jgi:hypothetical protein
MACARLAQTLLFKRRPYHMFFMPSTKYMHITALHMSNQKCDLSDTVFLLALSALCQSVCAPDGGHAGRVTSHARHALTHPTWGPDS